eukprot:669141-Prymnesium_polylepis.1
MARLLASESHMQYFERNCVGVWWKFRVGGAKVSFPSVDIFLRARELPCLSFCEAGGLTQTLGSTFEGGLSGTRVSPFSGRPTQCERPSKSKSQNNVQPLGHFLGFCAAPTFFSEGLAAYAAPLRRGGAMKSK